MCVHDFFLIKGSRVGVTAKIAQPPSLLDIKKHEYLITLSISIANRIKEISKNKKYKKPPQNKQR